MFLSRLPLSGAVSKGEAILPAEKAPYGRITQRAPAVPEVHIVWITAGLGCDGDSVSITTATQPSIEDVLLGAIPGLPKVHLHNPVLAYEVGDDFMKYWYLAEQRLNGMNSQRILVAGIGNIFFGDDAFGCEVAKQLSGRELPENMRVVEFGIRRFDLAYALLDAYDLSLLVDATQRGGKPCRPWTGGQSEFF